MTTRLWMLIQQWLDAQLFHVSQAQLADKLGVTRSAVSQWKHGQARPTPANLRDIAALTRIPYVDLRTALVEDLGYLVEEVASDDSTPIAPSIIGREAARVERADPPPSAEASPPPMSGSDRPGLDG